MKPTLFDSELKLMELLWAAEPISAKDLSLAAAREIGWNKNTTYTILKKLVDKGVVARSDPGFVCTALASRDEVQKAETERLVDRLYNGSKKALFSALLEDEALSPADLEELRALLKGR